MILENIQVAFYKVYKVISQIVSSNLVTLYLLFPLPGIHLPAILLWWAFYHGGLNVSLSACLLRHSLNGKKISTRDCLHWVGLSTCLRSNALVMFIDVRRHSPPWAAPFPRHEVLSCVRLEKWNRSTHSNKHAYVRFSLLFTVGVLSFTAVSKCPPLIFLQQGTVTWIVSLLNSLSFITAFCQVLW